MVARPVVALVVGFTKRAGLLAKSFAPLRRLKQAHVIDRILYVTWDKPELDAWVADVSAMPDVELVRIPEPAVAGLPYQKRHFYQTHNIAAALALVPDDDTLILKLRPDQVIDETFLAGKIRGFDRCCAPSRLATRFDAALPRSPFKRKIWIPWADANQPFFYEDGLFAALRCDAVKLVTPASDEIVRQYGDAHSAWIVHVARYIVPFLADYPIFERYLRAFRCFVQENDYRAGMLSQIAGTPFFWNLAIAHAWILANNFHVDCGLEGQIAFYPPERAPQGPEETPEPPFEALQSRLPYNDVEMWRRGQKPGEFLLCVRRIFGRLVDDSWQQALFTRPLSDLTPQNLRGVLRCVSLYRSGVLGEVEDEFYQTLEQIYRQHVPDAAATELVKPAA
jgi:hypothetical protein